MSIQAVAWVLDFSNSSYGSRLVLLSIANHCDKFGTDSWPKLETIAEESRLSLREVSYAIKELVELGELRVDKGHGQIGRNRYSLLLMEPAKIAGGEQINLQNATSEPAKVAGSTCKIPQRNKEEPSVPSIKATVQRTIPQKQVDEIYGLYPRMVGRKNANKAIVNAIVRLQTAGEVNQRNLTLEEAVVGLKRAVSVYARSPAGNQGQFTPHPATWFNDARYLDDVKEWYRNEREQRKSAQSSRDNENEETLARVFASGETFEDSGSAIREITHRRRGRGVEEDPGPLFTEGT
jgi:hypothetical protein